MSFVIRHSAAVAALLVVATAYGDSPKRPSPKSEEAFLEGLIELELYDLLDYQLKAHPPADSMTALLIQRRILLGVAEDAAESAARRRDALTESNQLLSRLIREHGTDERVLQWQLDLARSLIYEEAEPYYSTILHHGPTLSDREALRGIMDRALGTLTRLRLYLEQEYARIDELPLDVYERLDEKGYITALESAIPQTEYMLLWARFYAAIAEEENSSQQRELLDQVLNVLIDESELLTESHSVSHVQAQSLLLGGMTCRRLTDTDSAVRYLEDAGRVVESIANPEERQDLRWVVTLAHVERVRALCEANRPTEAMVVWHELETRLERRGASFGHQLVLAMLESAVIQARERGRPSSEAQLWSQPLSDKAIAPLVVLANRKPAYRDEVYAVLYARLADYPSPRGLHPFQQCAVIAGHIREASRLRQRAAAAGNDSALEAEAMRLIDSAIAVAGALVVASDSQARVQRCESLYNLAVAEHFRGRRLESGTHFTEVARDCPEFGRSLAAATYAVEIAAQLAEDRSLRSRSDVQDFLVLAMRTLDEGFPDSEAARYWRFFLAQAIEDLGSMDEAALLYERVGKEHPHFLAARFRAARCHIISLTDAITNRSLDGVAIKRQAGDAREAVRDFQQLAADKSSKEVRRLMAESEVLLAEMEVLPGVDRFGDALTMLADFENRHPTQRDLIGRVLRVRIVANEATGNLDEARQAVPRFVASSPKQAGPTLQALFDATREEIERYEDAGRDDLASQKAKSALLFAEQLYQWAKDSPGLAAEFDAQVLRVQLAEAYLEADQPEHALVHFQDATKLDAERYDDGMAHHPRIVLGRARSLEGLGRYGDALPLFNQVFTEAEPGDPQRFASLLGDLRCRTELGEPAQGIIDVIRQQRFMHPDMGGEKLKAAFAELQRRNQERL